MESRHNRDWSRGDDLIDFEVGSPDISRGTLTDALLDEDRIAETLLDSELLRLEETLQTASSSSPQCRSRCSSRDSIELEHILISIDDDDYYSDASRTLRSKSNRFDEVRNESSYICSSNNVDNNVETDEIDGLDSNEPSPANIDDCLRDLDNYLQGFDTSGSDFEASGSDLETRQQIQQSSDNNVQGKLVCSSAGITDRLRLLASRSRSLRHGKANAGYEEEMSPRRNAKGKRPLSADWNRKPNNDHGDEPRNSELDEDEDADLEEASTSAWNPHSLKRIEFEDMGKLMHKRHLSEDFIKRKRNAVEVNNKRPSYSDGLDDSLVTNKNQLSNAVRNVTNKKLRPSSLKESVGHLEKVSHKRHLSEDWKLRSKRNTTLESQDWENVKPPSNWNEYHLMQSKSEFPPEWGQIGCKRQFLVDWNHLKRKTVDRPTASERSEIPIDSLRRPVSADGNVASFGRNNRLRSTIGVCGRSVPCVSSGSANQVEYDTDEEIDWSWVEDVVHDGTPEEACADSIPSTGTPEEHTITIIDPSVQAQPVACSSTAPSQTQTARMLNELAKVGDDGQRGRGSSWLRSSMRRVRHFRLPSDPAVSDVETVIAAANSTPNNVSVDAVPVVVNRETLRPASAPIRTSSNTSAVDRSRSRSRASEVSTAPGGRARSSSESSRSRRRARSLSSSESSLASSVDSSPSCTPVSSPTLPTPPAPEATPTTAPRARRPCDQTTGREAEMPESHSLLGQWPHSLSSMLACLGCTLGLFNVSRFAILTVRFGANFILQFLVLSFVFGIPLFTLQLCLGQQLGAGVVDMWRISPLFQGVGIALLVAQALIGLYSIVGISWMFIYFRDSFITKQDQYRWAEPYEYYREESRQTMNGTFKLTETVPDYFSGVVLQRHNLVTGNSFGGAIKFQVAFNLAVVWMIVFVSLSKGLRSYAKVVFVFTLLPIFGTFILCAKLLGMAPNESLHEVFPETSWGEFFLNSRSWIAASQEAFLTWGLLGASVMQIASHNKHKHLLQRDSSLVIILTITILMLTAFLANTCIEILHFYGYNYMPNSFEKISTYIFLRSTKDPLPPSLSSTPIRYMTHSSYILGEKVIRPGMDRNMESGYQVLRFATELVPATLAILGPTQISPFWAVLFYFILILFGIAQQLAIWHCVITGIMAFKAKVLKSWETTITFFTCTFGFILGLPMTTELGIYVVYFLDYVVGGAWWLVLVYLIQIVAVFMVRGRPYSGDTVVTALFTVSSSSCVQNWLAPLLSFTWNVILPVALMVVCITQFKSGNFKELFVWHHAPSLEYWPTWTRQIGSLLQLMPILCIPIVAIVQSYRYLNNGPPDILDRIQLLYRPPMNSEHLDDLAIQAAAATTTTTTNSATTNPPAEDPPPKYTPPPSYTTATGARIAKLLRQSIRRSVRRLANVLGESSNGPRAVERPQLQVPPPDYSTVLVEMNNQSHTDVAVAVAVDTVDSSRYSTSERISHELSNLPQGSPLTAADVASILRSSFRRSTVRSAANRMRRSAPEEVPSGSLSVECLVDGIAPLGEDSLVLETISTQINDIETKGPNNNRFSVI